MNVRIGKLAVGFDPITGLWHWSFWVLYDGGERGSRWTPLTYLRMMTFSAAHTFASATCEWTLERIGVAIRSDGLFLTHVSFQNGKVFFFSSFPVVVVIVSPLAGRPTSDGLRRLADA